MRASAFVSFFVISAAHATATGDFWIDLGALKAAEPAVASWQKLCEKETPANKPDIQRAIKDWKARNKVELQQVEKIWSTALFKEAKGGERAYLDNLEQGRAAIEKMTKASEEKFVAQPVEARQRDCLGFVKFLDSGKFDLAVSYKDELEIVRRGPKR